MRCCRESPLPVMKLAARALPSPGRSFREMPAKTGWESSATASLTLVSACGRRIEQNHESKEACTDGMSGGEQ